MLARGALVAHIISAVTRRPARSQLIRGPSGIGKTTIAAHAARALSERGLRVVPIVGLAELTHVPLAALAPLLATAPASEKRIDLRAQSLVTLIGAAPNEYILVVDDAPLLDDISASTLYQLIRVFGVAAVMTARDEHKIHGPLERLHHENLLDVIDVPPLSAVEVEEIVERYLDRPLQPDMGATLQRHVEGNPLYLREIVFEAQHAGRVLAKDFGVVIEPTSLPRYWLDNVRTRIIDLHPAARQLAQLLSVSQPWPASLALSMGADALDELRRRAVVSIAPDERQLVRLAHPFFTEAIAGDMSTTVHKETVRRAAAALRSTGVDSDRFTAAHLLLGEPETDVRELEWAASFARDARDAAAGLRLARAARYRGGDFTTDFILAVAAPAVGDVTEAEEGFASSMLAAPSDEDRALVLLRWGQHEAYRMRRPELAISRSRDLANNAQPSRALCNGERDRAARTHQVAIDGRRASESRRTER
nr:ATP-binding protein [Microbacterium halimionae]